MYNVNQSIRKRPYSFIKQALDILPKDIHSVIVEIGSMRKPCDHDLDDFSGECCNDGHSSLLLARGASEFHTVDINMECSKLTRSQLKKYNFWSKSNVYCGDGIKFLKDFDKKIDLLYLDAWDVEYPQHAEMHLEAFKVAESKLNDTSIILIDDTDIGFSQEKGYHNDEECLGGKGKLLIPFLLEKKNFKMLFKGRQTGFIKTND
jgi:hypothetical protein